MPKTKNLKGIPGNLALSYLSTLGYYENGYMADWIIRLFKKLHIDKLTIDIIEGKVNPKNAEIKPLVYDIPKLRQILKTELQNNGFEENFIKIAELNFEQMDKNTLKCNPILEDINGKKYFPKKPIIELSHEI